MKSPSASKEGKHNTTFLPTMGSQELSFDDTDALMDNNDSGNKTVLINRNSSRNNGKNHFSSSPFSKSPFSERPESESILSMRHLSEGGKAMRTTDPASSQFNMLNMYIGIALIALPKAVAEVGLLGSVIGLVFINLISLGASYFLLKARNRFKNQRIIDFPDLANTCYGSCAKRFAESVLIIANTSFAMAQGMYLGGQADLLACQWMERPDECGKHRQMYSFLMMALISPLMLIPDFKKLSAFSSFFIFCCITSLLCIIGFELLTIHMRVSGAPLNLTYSDEKGAVVTASNERLATAFDFEWFNYAFFPLFLGEVMSIFEGNVGLLNIYSQQNQPRSMFKQTAITHAVVGLMCITIGTLSYLAYGDLTQDIVLYNLPQDNKIATVVAILYMLNIVGSITMTIQPIYGLFEKSRKAKKEEDEPAPEDTLHNRTIMQSPNDQENSGDDTLNNEDDSSSCVSGDSRIKNVVPAVEEEQSRSSKVMFVVRRLSIPFAIIGLSTLFPNVNMILSLLAGDVCGVCLIVMPVLFYRAAYIQRPSKKSRIAQILLGYTIVLLTVPIGLAGIYLNMMTLMYGGKPHAEVIDDASLII